MFHVKRRSRQTKIAATNRIAAIFVCVHLPILSFKTCLATDLLFGCEMRMHQKQPRFVDVNKNVSRETLVCKKARARHAARLHPPDLLSIAGP